jgi:hypothetical protein
MTSIDIETLLTIIFVHVDDWYQDDWYQEKGRYLLKGKAGRKPVFSDREVMHPDGGRGVHPLTG